MIPSMSKSARVFSTALLFTIAAGLAPPVAAEPLPIAQEPLFLTARVKPAFIMAVDDSGSMTFELLFPQSEQANFDSGTAATNGFFTANGTLRTSGGDNFYHVIPNGVRIDANRQAIPPIDNFGFSRSPDINAQYFDPTVEYVPWKRADGTSYPPSPTNNALTDPRNTGSLAFDFTTNRRDTGNNRHFRTRTGMRLPAGTVYYVTASCGGLGTNDNTRNTWVTLNTTHTMTGNCNVWFEYFPATYFLSLDTPVPAGFDATRRTLAVNAGGPGVDLYKYEIRSANYTSPAAYNAAIQNFANWYTYYGNRNRSMIASLTLSFADIDFMRVGYFKINSRPRLTPANRLLTMRDISIATQKQALYSEMIALDASGGTPNRSAVSRMGEQFTRTDAGAPIQLACQINAGMLFTDGFTNETGISDGARNYGDVDGALPSPFGGNTNGNTIADIATYYYLNNLRPGFEAGRVPVPSACNSPNPDVRLNCQRNLHMNFYGITLGATGAIYNVNQAQTEDPFANPPPWSVSGTANLVPGNVDDIWHASLNTYGEYINARNPFDVTNAMRDVLNAVLDSSQPSGSLSLTGARIGSGTFIVSPSFSVGGNGTDWSGRMQAFNLNNDGSTGALRWDTNAVGTIPAHGARNIITVTTPGNAATRVPRTFTAGNLGNNQTQRLANLGVTASDINLDFPGATAEQIVDYIRGQTTLEIRNGGGFRDRTTRLGDIVNSIPRIVSPRADFGYRLLPGAAGSSYQGFVESKSTRPPMVYVGANAGMLHAFNGNTGQEVFGFVPNAMLGNRALENGVASQRSIGQLASRRYEHSYYVDGPVTVADAYVSGNWRQVLVGAAGAGGKSVFALDVTNPTAGFGTGNVMWEVNQRTDNDIGFVLGEPLILPIAGERWVALFPNGYNSANGRAALFMVDLATGNVQKIVADPAGTENNGLGNIIAVDDTGDGLADLVYGGDLLGNVWKFDLTGAGSVANGGTPLFVARDGNGTRQPITGGFDVSAGPGDGRVLYFGTGRYIAQNDNIAGVNPPVQSIYAIWDNGTAVTGDRATVLQEQRILSETTPPNPSRQTTQNLVNYSSLRGWYMDLRVEGQPARAERFIGTPRLQSGKIFFTTFEPIGDPCTAGGRNWLYGLDSLTGGAGLANVSIGSIDGAPACLGEGCGALGIADGAPVRDTVLSIPPPSVIPGIGCEVGVDPGCEVPADLNAALSRCTLVVQAAGSPPIYLPRPCGRQSWRQIR